LRRDFKGLMKKYLAVLASFVIMLCLGGVYAWSIVAPELTKEFGFTSAQSQSIFGLLIGILPVTMIFAGKLERRLGSRALGFIAAILFVSGYLISGFSGGRFWVVLLGNGVLAGMGTAFGYLAALTSPVKLFPEKKGLMTGIAVGGFGLAAVALSFILQEMLDSGMGILEAFRVIGLAYGSVIFVSSMFLFNSRDFERGDGMSAAEILRSTDLYRLISGFFFGSFAGLLVVGSLKPIGAAAGVEPGVLVAGVSIFAIANFAGRISWGLVSDRTGACLTIFMALSFQAVSIVLLGTMSLTSASFLALSAAVGFGFGGNFVLFAKETAEIYGIENLGLVYPYVSFGYSLGGLFGPVTGGLLYDCFRDYRHPAVVAGMISMIGASIFLVECRKIKKRS